MLYYVQSPYFKMFLTNSKMNKDGKNVKKTNNVEGKRGQDNPGSFDI